MRTHYLGFIFLLSGCSLSSHPIESLSPPIEVIPSPSYQKASDSIELSPKKNVAKLDHAQEFYLWAAKEGYPQAQKIYGQWLIDQNEREEGLLWLEKSSAQGCDLATLAIAQQMRQVEPQMALERLYPLIAKNFTPALLLAADLEFQQEHEQAAITFLEKASDQGDLCAQVALAERIAQHNAQPWSQVQHLPAHWDSSLSPEFSDLHDLWPSEHPKPNLTLNASEKRFEWISPQEFIAVFADASIQGSPFAAYQQMDLRLKYPTLFPPSSTSMGDLAHIASSIPPGAVLQARLILKNQIPGTYQQAWKNLEFASDQKNPYALFACSLRARHDNNLLESLRLYKEGLSQQNYEADLLLVSQDLIEGILGFFEDQAGFDSLFYLAQSGNPYALLTVAHYKMTGKISGTPQEAFLMRYQAAWNGIPSAQYLLANMYLTGQGIAQSDQKAFRWFYQSARSGYRPAQYQLSQMYQHGQGVLPSLVQAYAWRKISMRGLHEDPQYQVSDLATQLSWDQLAQAVALASHYKTLYAHSGVD